MNQLQETRLLSVGPVWYPVEVHNWSTPAAKIIRHRQVDQFGTRGGVQLVNAGGQDHPPSSGGPVWYPVEGHNWSRVTDQLTVPAPA